VDEVAALLKVSRSWVYEHTRARVARADRLPFVKIGKYVRFQPRAVGDFLAKRSRIA
jgi:excisionase family DNA binding protein